MKWNKTKTAEASEFEIELHKVAEPIKLLRESVKGKLLLEVKRICQREIIIRGTHSNFTT